MISLVALSGVRAQDKFKQELSLGASFGTTFSKVSFAQTKVQQKMKMGYTGGLSLRWITEKNLGLQAELNFTQHGWDEKFEDQPQYKYSRTINYIELPILTHIYFGSKRFRVDDAQMHDFYQLARELELDVLVETHDEAEVERAMKINPRIIGVNNRNLKDFTISLEHTRRLRPYVPEDKVFVAESGITGDEDVRFLRDCGVDAFLIGRAFMESENPKALAQKWKELYQA